ncbi:diaminopropionate ammonia-lyase [Phaeobacter sp. C3_T13_0]|uniref:diaminopropionate ammonia-lyase n=1 Tax=Phaeobacter cretensis TaxID=3342641 RepID=UPI0039BD07BE
MLGIYENTQSELFTRIPSLGAAVTETLSRRAFDDAAGEIFTWDGYEPTPMPNLTGLADQLGLQEIHYKHEGSRFGLGSFKALGGAYATLRVLQRKLSETVGRDVTVAEIQNGDFAAQIAESTVISATDGNHGRSVAWGAKRFGANCRIYIHAEVSPFRERAMQDLGAEVIRIDGDYDATVAQTRVDAEKHGWMIVSDTSWPGYTQPPLDVMAGYGVMAREIVRDLQVPPTHVFLQGGVGGLAAAVIAVFHQEWGIASPRSIIVEPELAPCLFASGKANTPTSVKIREETMMAGLSCGEPSQSAWEILGESVDSFMTIPEHLVAPTVRMLANGDYRDPCIDAGESAVAGLIGLMCGALDPKLRADLKLDADSRVVIIGSEGITDPTVFKDIIEGRI